MVRSIVLVVVVSALAGQLGCSGSHETPNDAGVDKGSAAGTGGTAAGTGGSAAGIGGGAAGTGGSATGIGGSAAGTGGSAAGTGGTGGGPGCTLQSPGPRALTKVLDGAPWTLSQRVGGMAVDAQNRVYLEDGGDVWRVDCQSFSDYLTLDEAAAKTPPTLTNRITGLDLGPDGLLYVAMSGPASGGKTVSVVVRSSAAHVAEPWIDVSSVGVARVAVISADRVAIVNATGLYTASAADQTLVYPTAMLQSAEGCTRRDLTAAPTGVFLYQPGCNGSALYRGNVDGSGVATVTGFTPTSVCTARDPKGGFYMVIDDCPQCATRIYHLADGATDRSQATLVETTPSLADVKTQESQANLLAFEFCSMAAASDGSLYIQSYQQLWKVWP